MGSNSCSTSSGGVWSLMPYSPSSLSQQKKKRSFYFEISKDGSVFYITSQKAITLERITISVSLLLREKLKHVGLQTKTLQLTRELPECTKQLDFLIFDDVANVKQCFHRFMWRL